jgi:hypothetical protein
MSTVTCSLTETIVDGEKFNNTTVIARLIDENGNPVIDFSNYPKTGTTIQTVGFLLNGDKLVLNVTNIKGNIKNYSPEVQNLLAKLTKIIKLFLPVTELFTFITKKLKKISTSDKVDQFTATIEANNLRLINENPYLKYINEYNPSELLADFSLFGYAIINGQQYTLLVAKIKGHSLLFFNI